MTSFTLVETSAIITNVAGTMPTCNVDADAITTVLAAGGTPSYNYVWSKSITGPQTTGLVSGTYIVTVTYGNRCTAVGVVLILNPASTSANSKENTLYYGDANGLVGVTAMGDTAPKA